MNDLLEADFGTTSSESALKRNFRLARDLPRTEPPTNALENEQDPFRAVTHTTFRRRRRFGYGILLTSNQVLQVIAAP
jgi:hypothetical protein